MQTIFDPIVWFGGFTERTRKRVVRHLLNTFEKRDPQFLESTSRWGRGEPVRAPALIPTREGFRTISVYLSVENGDLRLLRMIERHLEGNRTKFDTGLTVLRGGNLRESWLLSLGKSTFSLFGSQDILELLLAHQQSVQVPAGLRIGQLFPGQLPPNEGMVCQLFHGQILIIASFEGVSGEEVEAVLSAPIDVGLLKVTSGLALLAMRVPGLIDGWADLPIALGIEDPENAFVNPPDIHGRIGLVMILIDRASRQVGAIRFMLMRAGWSNALLSLLDEQRSTSRSYTKNDYFREIEISRRIWPDVCLTPKEMIIDTVAGNQESLSLSVLLSRSVIG